MLTNTLINNAKPKNKLYRINDGNGLCLEITPKGAKRWRFRYRFGGKEKMLSLGLYPAVTLKAARVRAEDLRRQLGDELDPSLVRKEKITSAEHTFQIVALEWLDKYSGKWSEGHAKNLRTRLERGIFPDIGELPISNITPPLILEAVRKIEARGALELAHRTLQITSQVFRYGVACGKCERDPTQDLRGALPPVVTKHRAALTDPKEVAGLLRAMDGYSGAFQVQCALKLSPYLFLRPGELRHARWTEFDFDAAIWRIPADRMKMKREHLVPLAKQVLAILDDLHALTGRGQYLFPSVRTESRPISENTINAALRRLGYTSDDMCAHGFRTIASTMLHEQGWNSDAVERQLAHAESDQIKAAYNRALHLPERTKMMQSWADYLDALKTGAKVTPIRSKTGSSD